MRKIRKLARLVEQLVFSRGRLVIGLTISPTPLETVMTTGPYQARV